jgi:hypothetical protein
MRILVAIGVVTAALLATSTAAAADQSLVNAYGCHLQGGHVYRPAGTTIVARFGWAAKNDGLVQDFVEAQTTTVATNGGAAVDVSNLFSRPANYPPGGFVSWMNYDTGIALAPGESMTFRLASAVSHRVLDGIVFENGEFGRPLFGEGTILDATCTVTGV